VSETFLKLKEIVKNYNSAYNFSTYLYKIAYNNAIDKYRKRRLLKFIGLYNEDNLVFKNLKYIG